MDDDTDFSSGDVVPQTVQAPDLPDLPAINPNDSVFQTPSLPAPSIMGGVDFYGSDLPVRGPEQPMPWTVQGGGLPQLAIPSLQGGTQQPPDRASGIGRALGDASRAITIAHGTIGTVGLAGKVLGLLPKAPDALGGLSAVTNAITAPLDFGAGTATDIGNGADQEEAVMGNGIREGLVQASGIAGGVLGGLAAGAATEGAGAPYGASAGQIAGRWLANRYLPDGAAIGHGVIQVLKNPPDPKFYTVF